MYRLRFLPGRILGLASILVTLLGIYVATVGYANQTSLTKLTIHGVEISAMTIGELNLYAFEVAMAVGVLIFLTGFTVVYRLTTTSAGYSAGIRH